MSRVIAMTSNIEIEQRLKSAGPKLREVLKDFYSAAQHAKATTFEQYSKGIREGRHEIFVDGIGFFPEKKSLMFWSRASNSAFVRLVPDWLMKRRSGTSYGNLRP
jgi:hypothetical protein